MNGSFYQNPTFPNNEPLNSKITPEEEISELNEERTEDTDFWTQNKGKKAKVYASFPFSAEWKDKMFEGIIQIIEKDSLIISEPENNIYHIIPTSYIDYITIDDKTL